MNKLEKHVKKWIKQQAVDYSDGVNGVMRDLMYGGCQSGFVTHLIYYTDTVKFYKKYKDEINELLATYYDSAFTLFGDKWDVDDPLALDTQNQNLLAWFGFEETASRLYPDWE